MKIMITGVAGFIGANLAERLLRDGHRVIGVDNLAYGLQSNIPEGVEFHQLDIRGKVIKEGQKPIYFNAPEKMGTATYYFVP